MSGLTLDRGHGRKHFPSYRGKTSSDTAWAIRGSAAQRFTSLPLFVPQWRHQRSWSPRLTAAAVVLWSCRRAQLSGGPSPRVATGRVVRSRGRIRRGRRLAWRSRHRHGHVTGHRLHRAPAINSPRTLAHWSIVRRTATSTQIRTIRKALTTLSPARQRPAPRSSDRNASAGPVGRRPRASPTILTSPPLRTQPCSARSGCHRGDCVGCWRRASGTWDTPVG
mmetsp:Transcript_3835/g.8595  ORF Transcript_3835/g.8595 Transcript_3835/m.8595 type:complete len:222 (+) Transcript_3835:333-998(+)